MATEADPDTLDYVSRALFGLYGSFSQAWFMGVMFFIAAFFAALSYARRGAASFMKERLFRLGVPLLVCMFAIFMFHTPVIIAISLMLRDWSAPPLLKHVVVVPTAYAATLCLSALVLRKIPGLRAVLK